MPKGPNGERRPGDVIGCAVTVGRIATGDVEEIPAIKSGRVKSGKAGAEARASKLSPERRTEVARKAADARWRGKGESEVEKRAMGQKLSERKGFSKPADNTVRMYPNNGLKQPIHDFDSTFSAASLMDGRFFTLTPSEK
jgi:hypothetical protein